MKIYDESVEKVLALLKDLPKTQLLASDWADVGKQNLVLRNEMAYELGAGALPGVSFLAITTSEALVPEPGMFLYGPDLPEIRADRAYGRLVLLRVKEGLFQSGEAIYDGMRAFRKVRYEINPQGYMSRVSTSTNHEPIRVSRKAIQAGLNFSKVAHLYAQSYGALEQVEAVQVIFVTATDFDYEGLKALSRRTEEITSALDHVLRDVQMDCGSCKLQTICNEVEGLKDLHFKA